MLSSPDRRDEPAAKETTMKRITGGCFERVDHQGFVRVPRAAVEAAL